MDLNATDRRLLGALENGLALVSRPFAHLAEVAKLTEAEVLTRLRTLIDEGVIRRFGVIVHHRELGYRANAMVVWDVPDERVSAVGHALANRPYVTLCYRRPRRLPDWPYNLFCMIHGRDRPVVESLIEEASQEAGIADLPRAVLFSRRRFKQRGARYSQPSELAKEGAAE